jgi:penicillin-binding protein 2
MGLQQEAEHILEGQTGAIVVLDADSGEVLAMASTPGYDPNIFATNSPIRGQLVADALHDKLKPTLNRGFQFHYPPGSVFKVLLAIAGLEEGVINENTHFVCNGKFFLPGVNRPWRCWRLKYGGHGSVEVVDALAYSCDVFFYNVGLRLGPERITKWANQLGLGARTGIDLPGEEPGLVPGPEWKRKQAIARGETEPWQLRWYDGETVNMSIGQGMVLATPLQNALLMAAVLNGGRRVRPFINVEMGPKVSEPLVSEKTLRLVEEGLRKCVQRVTPPSGTGKEARIDGLDILGKTGTAQVVRLSHTSDYASEEEIPYQYRDHALFVAGVTDRTPRIAVSVLVEHGLHGSSAAAPAARKIFEYFYVLRDKESPPSEPVAPVTVAKHEAGQ